MNILRLLYVTAAQAFYRWALREISPMHPDVPHIIARQLHLADLSRRLWGPPPPGGN